MENDPEIKVGGPPPETDLPTLYPEGRVVSVDSGTYIGDVLQEQDGEKREQQVEQACVVIDALPAVWV